MLAGLAAGRVARAVWSVLPGDDWAEILAEAVVATAASGRGALVCVPDHRDVARLDAALTERLGNGGHVVLAADSGPAKRYRAFLAISRGAVRIVIGTRAAVFAPVQDLGLVAIWDDGTISMTSRGRLTPMPARFCSCARRRPVARPCWRRTPAAWRRSTSFAPAGPPRSSARATSYASASPCT